jgi:tRNA dimethylallyltransferase
MPSSTHLALVGATATGKTDLAVALARRCRGVELVSVDAMAVYRGLDVGTAKPTEEQRAGIVWHMLDVVEPSEDFSVAEFQAMGRAAIRTIEARGHVALFVGGTGLYHRALLDDLDLPGRYPEIAARLETEADSAGVAALHRRLAVLDPLAAARIEPGNRRRVVRALEVTLGSGRPFSASGPGLGAYRHSNTGLVGLFLERDELDRRIAERLDAQVRHGFLDEVRTLAVGGGLGRTARQAIGYRELLAHLDGRSSFDEAVAETLRRTRAFARRQERWFRRDPRVVWWRADEPDLAERVAEHLDGRHGSGAGPWTSLPRET